MIRSSGWPCSCRARHEHENARYPYQPTLPAPSRRTLRVPPQPWVLALASDLRSSLAVHLLDHGRLFAADGPSTSPYAANALLPMSVELKTMHNRLHDTTRHTYPRSYP